MTEKDCYKNKKRRELIREIEILKEVILKSVEKGFLMDRIILLEHARTRYFDIPKSWVKEFEEIIEEEDENE